MSVIDKVLFHYGIKRKSGRYPWGSGQDPEQRGKSFLGYINELEAKNLSEGEIAARLGITVTQLRSTKSIAKNQERVEKATMALKLKDKGMSNVAIGQRMGIPESSVRALLDPALKKRSEMIANTSNVLKTSVGKARFVDVGGGVESHLGVSRTKMDAAVELLRQEGYQVFYVKQRQLGTGKATYIKVLAPPGTPYAEVAKNKHLIRGVYDHSEDGGRTFNQPLKPVNSLDSKRVYIRYKEDGGKEGDGTIELRKGAEGLDLGGSKYAQVRIGVDGTHYMKGMAFYSDNIPKGYDVVYNTNKPKGTSPEKVFKEMLKKEDGSVDNDYPFQATIKPGGQKGHLNIVNEEGDWGNWSKSISSQVLSKQSPDLAKRLLKVDLDRRVKDLQEIESLTNPSVKRKLLMAAADELDAAAVDLKAASLPRQGSHVLIPIRNMKEGEVYAPNYRDGERVVLIRHPHGGKFEIPELIVNNKNKDARSTLGSAMDAIGINPKVAEKLSGADFDGDTVLVIPNKNRDIKVSPSLKGLKDFDPKEMYPEVPGMRKMTKAGTQLQMGDISNLITDMTIKGASNDEIARAVRHSMVVIDAEKHKLDYRRSAIDNGIAQLKAKYQGSERAGAATLISRAGSQMRVDHRSDNYTIDPNTGEKVFKKTGETYPDRSGKIVKRQTLTTKMSETRDAFSLSSGTKMESVYAEHANVLKKMANAARLRILNIKSIPYSPTANRTYKKEVDSLLAKLEVANRNRPLERKAQLLADHLYKKKKDSNKNLDKDALRKLKGQALEAARRQVGAKKTLIDITPSEWMAIQLGAISTNRLMKILDNADMDSIKAFALPKSKTIIPRHKVFRAKAMLKANNNRADIADALGLTVTQLNEILKQADQ